ncbi:MAG TPA: N-acetylmuramoyl-L-alanine amidase [Prolixibacteraceae bacterium]|nr:N-acetylmuramoyl-L-alanine amidase [Prolixibacteraceae bacterium]
MLRKTRRFILFLFFIILSGACYAQMNAYSIKKVVIDAGHGGKDPGATVGKFYEKDIVLDVALKTGRLISKQFPEVEVIYTRDRDIFIPLDDRAVIANKKKADLFISIHANICSNGSTLGAETYILGQHRSQENLEVAKMENSVILLEDNYSKKYEGFDPNSAESYIMFELIQNEFLEQSRLFADRVQNHFVSHAKRKDRGVRQAGFLVLRKTAMPSALVELGYMSNNSERDFLEKESGRSQLAESIVRAFSDYKMRFDERNAVSAQQMKKDEQKDTNVMALAANQRKNSTSADSADKSDGSESVTPKKVSDQKNILSEKSDEISAKHNPSDKDISPVATSSTIDGSQGTAGNLDASLAAKNTNTKKQTNSQAGVAEPVKVNEAILNDASALKGKWYGIQVTALKTKLRVKDPFFKNYAPVYYLSENGIYKYYLGLTQDFGEVQSTFNTIGPMFKGAFLVSFIDGQKKILK